MKKLKIVLKRMDVQTKEIYEEFLEYNENITILNLSNQILLKSCGRSI